MPTVIWQKNNYRIVQKDTDPANRPCRCSHKEKLHNATGCSSHHVDHRHHSDQGKKCQCKSFRPIVAVCTVEQLFNDSMGEKSWRSVSQFDESSRGVRLPAAVFFDMMEKFVEAGQEVGNRTGV